MRCIMWVILLILAVINCSESADECYARFSVSICRNQTGYWLATVQPEHGDLAKDELETGRSEVTVDQTAEQCGDTESVNVFITVVAPPELAGRGYELFPGVGYYKMHPIQINWEEARMICVNEGAHLAIINSEAEAEVLASLRSRSANATEYNYLGFHNLVNNGEFITVLGDSLDQSGYLKWKSGEPNNYLGNEHCGSMTKDALLNDHGCDNGLNFICEHELF